MRKVSGRPFGPCAAHGAANDAWRRFLRLAMNKHRSAVVIVTSRKSCAV
jgi:hypothetical protein